MDSILSRLAPEFCIGHPKVSKTFDILVSERAKSIAQMAFWQDLYSLTGRLSTSLKDAQFVTEISDVITIAPLNILRQEQNELLRECVMRLRPWRTGPFELAGLKIESEWRSELRWQRIKPFLPNCNGLRIADVGCGNGYFIFRMTQERPELVIGFDPTDRCYLQFELLNSLAAEKSATVVPLGIEQIQTLEHFFDFTLCMGVMYHRRDPHTCLRNLRTSLKKGGRLLLESLIYPGDESFCFCPPDRYMKMRNVWFMPTASCMCDWLKKVGFTEIEVLEIYDIAPGEQRTTQFAPDESWNDFLDPIDPNKTVEGHPAPRRVVITALA